MYIIGKNKFDTCCFISLISKNKEIIMKRILSILLCVLLLLPSLKAQNFNFTLSKDSTIFELLTSSTTIAQPGDWKGKSFGLKLPYNLNFCGVSSDSITIQNNGYIDIVNSKTVSIIAFNNFSSNSDSSNLYQSLISYSITGNTGNRILKIQFLNLSNNKFSATDFLTYQIWLFENGRIEFHIGNSSYSSNSEFPIVLGVINRNLDFTDLNGAIINGNKIVAQLQMINQQNMELGYLNEMPSNGTVYSLIPVGH